jgi:hypothetical protein
MRRLRNDSLDPHVMPRGTMPAAVSLCMTHYISFEEFL